MKIQSLGIITAIAAGAALMAGCSGTNEPSPLVEQSILINEELNTLADESPLFLSSATASYGNGTLSVDIAFNDSIIEVDEVSDALVQYVLAQYMKSHTGENLDITLNTLGKEKGVMSLTLSDVYGNQKIIDLPSATLKKLVTTKPMELRYPEVRSNVLDIMEERTDELVREANAVDGEFSYTAGFAQYTLNFRAASNFANQTQGTLTGRYKRIFTQYYESYGACGPMIRELEESLQIDGIRVIYNADGKQVKTAMPWRILN